MAKRTTANTLEGWSRIIQEMGEQSRKKEEERKRDAKGFIESAFADSQNQREGHQEESFVTDMFTGLDSGLVTIQEFLSALRDFFNVSDPDKE